MRYTLNLKNIITLYILLTISSISIGVLISFLLSSDYFKTNPPDFGIASFQMVVLANVKDYVKYIILYPISPVMLVLDVIINSFQISMSIRLLGMSALDRIIPHSIIEIPNILLYHFLSFYHFCVFLKTRSFRSIIKSLIKFKLFYAISFFLIIFGAFVEGYMG